LPYLVRKGADQPELKQQWSNSAVAWQKQKDLPTLDNLIVSNQRTHLQLALWAEGTKNSSQTSILTRPLQKSHLHQMAHQNKKTLDSKNPS
jgi:hypothetical protein